MEQDILEKVLKEILQELKQQNEGMAELNQKVEQQTQKVQKLEDMVSQRTMPSLHISSEQASEIREALVEHFKSIQEEIARRPSTAFIHKYYSVLPVSFRVEHFPMVVNTTMKWILATISLFFVMWLIVHMVDR
ncbi:hypothetical protein SAMN05444008_10955 [Cnuella takakiae]|uniref:Uncharacterized protein n=1 Tax=Cnuella takakiae TaxID=1302690 RepID=A0A1M5CFX0_9BACT|nr:hypothetical protein [Cnuella takakiae]OLY91808.1 hypothetical protein BUE76_07770 [Cnuella takakiae]SHF53609.1 hypothetical protein SAMN05444008_10955 [Cnuella takakiae]